MAMLSVETASYRNLLAGPSEVVTEPCVVAAGADLSAGAVLGKIAAGAATGSTVTGTGSGTLGTITRGKKVQVGAYTLLCVAAATNGGLFDVVAPDGSHVGVAEVGTAFTSEQINFTIADGSGADFVVGDSFTITVAAGSGQYTLIDKTAVDGSAIARGVLAEDAAAASAAVTTAMITMGEVNSTVLSFTAGTVAADVTDDLRALGIVLRASQDQD